MASLIEDKKLIRHPDQPFLAQFCIQRLQFCLNFCTAVFKERRQGK
jgi:hypothetical protein